ncbi:MAG: hypothetical protein ACOX33_02660 [Dethiobacteria bacterium]
MPELAVPYTTAVQLAIAGDRPAARSAARNADSVENNAALPAVPAQ